jgi:hypothetical protein
VRFPVLLAAGLAAYATLPVIRARADEPEGCTGCPSQGPGRCLPADSPSSLTASSAGRRGCRRTAATPLGSLLDVPTDASVSTDAISMIDILAWIAGPPKIEGFVGSADDLLQGPSPGQVRLEELRERYPDLLDWKPAPMLFLDTYRLETAQPVSDPLQLDGLRRIAKAQADGGWGSVTSKVTLRDRDRLLDPSLRNTWETDESLRMPVAGPLFLFGQLGASSPSVEQQQLKWLGKTGVGVKIKPWLMQEVQVRGGPAVRYDDTGSLSRGQSPERSELFLEAATKVPLPVVGPLNVEYTSYAVPAATSADRNQINQDVKLAMPLSSGGQFHVGAKYKWENASASTPWLDRMQVYMGLELKR